jgi:hypothetical protein
MSARKPRSVPPVPRLDCSESEWRMRVNLAACYRLSEIRRMPKVIWNHIAFAMSTGSTHGTGRARRAR